MSLMAAVREDSQELAKATSRAEKITNLLFMSTNSLLSSAKKRQMLRDANHSRPRMRWILAIQRVLVQNAMKKYMVMIEAYEAKLKASSSVASSPTKLLGANSESDNRTRRLSAMKKAHEV